MATMRPRLSLSSLLEGLRVRDDSPALVTSAGISLRLWRMYGMFWLVCLGYAVALLLQTPPTWSRLLLAAVSLGFFVALYAWFIWPHPLDRPRRTRTSFRLAVTLFAALAGLALLLSLLDGAAWLWLLVCVSAVAGLLFPLQAAFVVVTGLTLLALGLGLWRDGWMQAIPLALLVRGLGLDMIGLVVLAGALRRLHVQRGELARLAVAEERLRVARDLHDLLGQTLSLLAVKSELARRLCTSDPTRAAEEMDAVERIARQTLREVRAAVAGYRQPTLQSELGAARELLEAAEIDSQIEQTAGALPPKIDGALAWTVREGVTNVVRHSRHARHCHIRVERVGASVRAAVTNDGYQRRERESGPGRDPGPGGSGLAGLEERVRQLGGTLVTGPLDLSDPYTSPGFHLQVTLPLDLRDGGEPAGGETAAHTRRACI